MYICTQYIICKSSGKVQMNLPVHQLLLQPSVSKVILHFLSQKAESHWVAASSCIGLGAQVAHVGHTTSGVWTHGSPSRLPPAVCVAVAGARLLARQPPRSRANGRHSAGIQDIEPCCAFCLCSWGSPRFRQRTVSTKSLFWPVGDVRAPFRFPLRGRPVSVKMLSRRELQLCKSESTPALPPSPVKTHFGCEGLDHSS